MRSRSSTFGASPQDKTNFPAKSRQSQDERENLQPNISQFDPRLAHPSPSHPHTILQLQRQHGNQYVNQMLQQSQSSRPAAIQAKMTLGAVGDQYEQEADRVAKQVVNQINAPVFSLSTPSTSVQQQISPEEDDELKRKSAVKHQANEQSRILLGLGNQRDIPNLQMTPKDQRLSHAEEASITYYMRGGYKRINLALRNGSISDAIQEHIDNINSGLAKLDPYTGDQVYRGVTLPPNVRQQYEQKNAIVQDPAFWSTSKYKAYQTEPHQFIVSHFDTGVDISHLSSAPEGEVLFPAGSSMRVLKVSKPGIWGSIFGYKWTANVVQAKSAIASSENNHISSTQNPSVPGEEMSQEDNQLMMKPILQRQLMPATNIIPPQIEASINQAKGSGQPLSDTIRKPMEQAFGRDFSGVKTHTDATSDQLNQSIQARAFTTGQDIFFRQGMYRPGSRDGQELIAHELSHVVQQGGATAQAQLAEQDQVNPTEDTVTSDQQSVIQRNALENATSLEELYNAKKGLKRNREHTRWQEETSTTTSIIKTWISQLIQDFVEQEPVPEQFKMVVLSFGSFARQELLIVSDIDLQIVMQGEKEQQEKAAEYANNLKNYINHNWQQQRNIIISKLETSNNSLAGSALQIDWVGGKGGKQGFLYKSQLTDIINSMEPQTKSKVGGKSDLYADTDVIFESGIDYNNLRNGYEIQYSPNNVTKAALVEWENQLNTGRKNQQSIKQMLIRPLTLAIGGIYRRCRRELNLEEINQPYKTNTLERANQLKNWEIIDDETLRLIKKLLLRSLKWEEEGGIDDWEHGAGLKPDRKPSILTRKGRKYIRMLDRAKKVRHKLMAACEKLTNNDISDSSREQNPTKIENDGEHFQDVIEILDNSHTNATTNESEEDTD